MAYIHEQYILKSRDPVPDTLRQQRLGVIQLSNYAAASAHVKLSTRYNIAALDPITTLCQF